MTVRSGRRYRTSRDLKVPAAATAVVLCAWLLMAATAPAQAQQVVDFTFTGAGFG